MKVLTYIDSGVLISAVCGESHIAEKAMAYLDDPDRNFASSVLVKLEVLPKAVYNKSESLPFYESFFSNVTTFSNSCDTYIQDALSEAETHGIGGMDALHILAAKNLNATEFITSERPTKPMFRTKVIKVISIRF